MEGHKLVFETANTVAPDKVHGPENVGLSSVRTLLEYSFPGRHRLETGLSGGVFTVRMECEVGP